MVIIWIRSWRDWVHAIALLKKYLKYNNTDQSRIITLTNLYLQLGQTRKAENLLKKASIFSPIFSPMKPSYPYSLSNLSFNKKKYKRALKYINQALDLMPNLSNLHQQKASIYMALKDTVQAKMVLEYSIKFGNDDFIAWASLRDISGQPPLYSYAPLPNIDSLIQAGKSWKYYDSEKGSIIYSGRDVYSYPNRSSFDHWLMVVHLSSQAAIDEWKEVRLPYNNNFQTLSIIKAVAYGSDGQRVTADTKYNKIVFTTLKPGDHIVFEWERMNYLPGFMSSHIYGEIDFVRNSPAQHLQLRLITPKFNPIPYKIIGPEITKTENEVSDYLITTFHRSHEADLSEENYIPGDWEDRPRVIYSTIDSWKNISQWYESLTKYKIMPDLEIKQLADSLTSGIESDHLKILQIHDYILKSIRYSYVSFRQSGWVPQTASDILATRIGDCKDMSTLAKSIMDQAGLESNLVLVNTRKKEMWKNSYIGPNFNHCILQCKIDGQDRYIDFTDANGTINSLPANDQGAMALIIRSDTQKPISLPKDKIGSRGKNRYSKTILFPDGKMQRTVYTKRYGHYAIKFRDYYRSQSQKQKYKDMQKVLARDWVNVELNLFTHDSLDILSDTVSYTYSYEVPNAITKSGSFITWRPKLSDKLETGDFPTEKNRFSPVNYYIGTYSVGTFIHSDTISIPKNWKLLEIPKPSIVKSPWGQFRLDISVQKNQLILNRKLIMKANEIIGLDKYENFKDFMFKITKADDLQLVFKE